jgi:hypothetical protein
MKIRTITAGINLSLPKLASAIRRAARFDFRAQEAFTRCGYEVQSIRVSTQPWPEYTSRLAHAEIMDVIGTIEELGKAYGVSFINIGTTAIPERIRMLPDMIARTANISASAVIGGAKIGIDYEAARAAADAIIQISHRIDRGYGNFRFAAIAHCPPDIPFYPAGFHRGPDCFSIGLECGDLVARAFTRARTMPEAKESLAGICRKEFGKVATIGDRLAHTGGFRFRGVDVSIAPSLARAESLVRAYERLGLGKFGAAGTLAISSLITDVLRAQKIKKCGYSGLMLPVLEDWGLARRFGQGYYSVTSLLAFSSVCGTGLDCVPLPGNIRREKLYAILLDVAALAVKLDKPLSARLLPVPGKKAGDRTDFRSPYLVDCRIPDIK